MAVKGIKEEKYEGISQEEDICIFKETLENHLKKVSDPRRDDTRLLHSLSTIMTIVVCAIMAGANSISAIYQYGKSKQEWLSSWIDLSKGIPSYNTPFGGY